MVFKESANRASSATPSVKFFISWNLSNEPVFPTLQSDAGNMHSKVVPQGFFSLGITVSVHEVALWKVTNTDSLARFFFFQ